MYITGIKVTTGDLGVMLKLKCKIMVYNLSINYKIYYTDNLKTMYTTYEYSMQTSQFYAQLLHSVPTHFLYLLPK